MSNPGNLPPARVEPGHYAVPDPDQRSRLTAWQVDRRGTLHRYPPGTRWEPVCPRLDHIDDRDERRTPATTGTGTCTSTGSGG